MAFQHENKTCRFPDYEAPVEKKCETKWQQSLHFLQHSWELKIFSASRPRFLCWNWQERWLSKHNGSSLASHPAALGLNHYRLHYFFKSEPFHLRCLRQSTIPKPAAAATAFSVNVTKNIKIWTKCCFLSFRFHDGVSRESKVVVAVLAQLFVEPTFRFQLFENDIFFRNRSLVGWAPTINPVIDGSLIQSV